MLIAIFALLLISVVAIALVVSSGTDSSLAGNYRTSTGAYYAAVAGLEEGRGRLLWKNPDCLVNRVTNPNCPVPNFVPTIGTLPNMGVTQVRYILNPANGETVDPVGGGPSNYPDNEYQPEYGWSLGGTNWQVTNSVSPAAGIPGPLYKWVRITPVTEKSIGLDVDGDNLTNNSVTPLYYDPAHQAANGTMQPGLIVGPSPTAGQALEITALAVLPNNTRKLLQYVVAPLLYGINHPLNATLVLSASSTASPGIVFQAPSSGSFQIRGNDGWGPLSSSPGCNPTAPSIWAVGVTDTGSSQANYSIVKTAIPTGRAGNYTGANTTAPPPGSASPNVQDDINLNLSQTMLTPSNLNNLVQGISKNADAVLNKNATESDMPTAMTSANPMTIVVNGNLTLNNFTGYGLLVVTGNIVADANSGWRGVVLVIGAGSVTLTGGPGGSGEYDGEMFVAQTLDWSVSPPNPLTSMGTATFDAQNAGGNGIFYNSCWTKAALAPNTYHVLSFHEVPLP
jgi:hypothetical protein